MPDREHSYPLTKISGKEYLEVKYRIDWLRKEHPDAAIETVIHSMDSTHAVVTARITIPNGGIATGSAMEEAGRFPFLEKAETSAIGRALGALGYGTLQSMEFDEEPTKENAKLADSPIERRAPIKREPSPAMPQAAALGKQPPSAYEAGEAKFIEEAKKAGLNRPSAIISALRIPCNDLKDWQIALGDWMRDLGSWEKAIEAVKAIPAAANA